MTYAAARAPAAQPRPAAPGRALRANPAPPVGRFWTPIVGQFCAPIDINQLWVADITYVAIAAGFVYVAVILDAWSRRVVGYAISRSIDVRLTLAALNAAIENRKPPTGCLHHSDRGSQYAAQAYREALAGRVSSALWAARQPIRQRKGGELHENTEG